MSCADTRDLFSDLVDDRLAAGDAARVEAHLAECAECRAELDRFRQMVSLLRAADRPRAPAGFAERVLAAARPPWYRRRPAALRSGRPLGLPVRAAALILVAALAVYVFEKTPSLRRAAEVAAPPTTATSPGTGPSGDLRSSLREAERAEDAAPLRPDNQALAPAKADTDARAPEMSPGAAPPPAASTSEARRSALEPARHDPASLAVPGASRVGGRLVVKDRRAAGASLDALLARLGATRTNRPTEGGGSVVVARLPAASYAELIRGLGEIGTWQPDAEPPAGAEALIVSVRIAEP